MDIWQWTHDLSNRLVAAGRLDVAETVQRLPRWAVDGHHDLAEAGANQLISASAELNEPWLEVFAHHWWLQSLPAYGASTLPQAVDAFERASRPDTTDCPQSVCVVQDLAMAYAAADGPGWAQERLAVTKETLDRINSEWSCWDCITIEKLDALVDNGQHEQASETLTELMTLRSAAPELFGDHDQVRIARSFLSVGDYAGALQALDAGNPASVGRLQRDRYWARRVRALLGLQRFDDAAATLNDPDVAWGDQIQRVKSRTEWLHATAEAARHDLWPNNTSLWLTFRHHIRFLLSAGTHRDAFDLAVTATELALLRQSRLAAHYGLTLAQRAQALLRFPSTVEAVAADLSQRVGAMAPHPLPVDDLDGGDALLAFLDSSDDEDLEMVADWLHQAVAAYPDHRELVERWATVVAWVTDPDLVLATLIPQLRRGLEADNNTAPELPADRWRAVVTGVVFQHGEPHHFEQVADVISSAAPADALWLRANAAIRADEFRRCLDLCHQIIALEDTAINSRRLGAIAAEKLGELDTSVDLYRAICERTDEPGTDDWALIEVATQQERWDDVRWAGNRLNMPFTSDSGPVDEEWGLIAIRPSGAPDDGSEDVPSLRTGPVTAKFLMPTWPGDARQRFHDVVRFNPDPVHDPDTEDSPASDDDDLLVFSEVATIAPGQWASWLVVGRRPDDEWVADARALFNDRGWRLMPHSFGTMSDGANKFDGVVFTVLAPEAVPATEVEAVLAEAADTLQAPLTWAELVAAAHGTDDDRYLDHRQTQSKLHFV